MDTFGRIHSAIHERITNPNACYEVTPVKGQIWEQYTPYRPNDRNAQQHQEGTVMIQFPGLAILLFVGWLPTG